MGEGAEPKQEKPWWQSKKFRATILGIIAPILNKLFDLGLDDINWQGPVAAATYVVGQGLADLGKNKMGQ